MAKFSLNGDWLNGTRLPDGSYALSSVNVDPATGLPSGASSTLPAGTSRSGSIATGGTAQQLAPANASRAFLTGQNLSTSDLWLNELGGTASAASPSYRIPAGGTFKINTNQAVSVYGATTGQSWSATEG